MNLCAVLPAGTLYGTEAEASWARHPASKCSRVWLRASHHQPATGFAWSAATAAGFAGPSVCSVAGTSWPGGCPVTCESPTAVAQRWRAQLLFLESFRRAERTGRGQRSPCMWLQGMLRLDMQVGRTGTWMPWKTPGARVHMGCASHGL